MENKDYSSIMISNSKESMNSNYAYNVQAFSESLSNETFGVLRKSEELTRGVDVNNLFQTKYIRCFTIEGDSVLIPVKNKTEESKLKDYKSPNQSHKEVVLSVFNSDTNSDYNISLFFSNDGTIFVKPNDVLVLRQTSPVTLRKSLINSIYDNYKCSGVSRSRAL